MEIASVSSTTKAAGVLSGVTTGGSLVWGMASGEFLAIATGVAAGTIGGVVAVLNFWRDKQLAMMGQQIAGLADMLNEERGKRKTAETSSDEWERRVHRLEGELADLKQWRDSNGCINAIDCPRRIGQ